MWSKHNRVALGMLAQELIRQCGIDTEEIHVLHQCSIELRGTCETYAHLEAVQNTQFVKIDPCRKRFSRSQHGCVRCHSCSIRQWVSRIGIPYWGRFWRWAISRLWKIRPIRRRYASALFPQFEPVLSLLLCVSTFVPTLCQQLSLNVVAMFSSFGCLDVETIHW